MKKAKLIAVLSFAGIAGSLLAGCNSTNKPEEHVHSYKEHAAVAATCVKEGKQLYYSCEGCAKLFDKDKKETTADALVVKALGHTMVHHEEKASTCVVHGNVEYFECSVCHDKFSDKDGKNKISETEKALAKHTGVLQAGEAATCTEAGFKDYYQCSVCQANFEDAECTKVIEHIAPWKQEGGGGYLAPLGHTMSNVDGKTPTCKEDGYKGCFKCSVCEKYFEDLENETLIGDEEAYNAWIVGAGKLSKTDVPHTEGKPVRENEVAPSCTEDGSYDEVVYCTVCGAEISRTPKVDPKLGHTMSDVDGKEPTCTEAGYEACFYCARCEKYFEDEDGDSLIGNEAAYDKWIDVGGGGYLAPVKHELTEIPQVDPQCEVAGVKHYYQCDDCKALFEDEDGKTPISDLAAWKGSEGNGYIGPKGHGTLEHKDGSAEKCTEPGFNEYWQCPDCKLYFSDSTATNKIGDDTALASWKAEGGAGYIAPKGHGTLVHKDGKAESCTEPGFNEYWQCPDCSIYFSDSAGNNEIGNEEALTAWKANAGKINPHNHTYGDLVAKVDKNRATDGMEAHYRCSECNGYFDTEKNPSSAEALKIKSTQFTVVGGEAEEAFDFSFAKDAVIVMDIKLDNYTTGVRVGFRSTSDGWKRTVNTKIYGATFEYTEKIDGGQELKNVSGSSYLGKTADDYYRYEFNLALLDKEAGFAAVDQIIIYKWGHSSGVIDVNPTKSIDTEAVAISSGTFTKSTTVDIPSRYRVGSGRFILDLTFNEADKQQNFMIGDGWDNHSGYIGVKSNGTFTKTFKGLNICLIEDKHVVISMDLTALKNLSSNADKIEGFNLLYFHPSWGTGDGTYTFKFESYYSSGAPRGSTFIYKGGESFTLAKEVDVATEKLVVDIKFIALRADEPKASIQLVQDSSNYFGNYSISPTSTACTEYSIKALDDGYYRFTFNLPDITWKKVGTPTTIKKFDFSGNYSYATGYIDFPNL